MGLKLTAYNLLVNKKKLIKTKYEAYTNSDEGKSAGAFNKARHLAWLNFSYYVLGNRSQEIKLPKKKQILPISESCAAQITADELIEKLSEYDVISFDVFDTLIYRYLAKPTDVFYFVGEKLGYPDYRRLRIEAEVNTRKEKHKLSGTYEVTLDEIADTLCSMTGLDKELIIKEELMAEKNFCYANPYMKKVWDGLLNLGKKPIILSDMYLSEEYMRELLTVCGYDLSDTEIIVSCDILKSKAEGSVYKLLKEMKQESKSFAHVGDNEQSDIKNAEKSGFTAFKCVNPDNKGNPYRTNEMSPLVRSVWAGLVNKKMHGSEESYDKYFSYGYNCGGLLIYGYANYIEQLAKEKDIDRILFLSRDGHIVKQVYDRYFGAVQSVSESGISTSNDKTLIVYCDYRLKLVNSDKNEFSYTPELPENSAEFLNMLFCDNENIADGILSFAEDYDRICGLYGFLRDVDSIDAIAPFSYAVRVKSYCDKLYAEYTDKYQMHPES